MAILTITSIFTFLVANIYIAIKYAFEGDGFSDFIANFIGVVLGFYLFYYIFLYSCSSHQYPPPPEP